MALKRKLEKKRVANWLGSPTRVIRQLIVSCWSYLSLPISKFHNNAAQHYFTNLYKGKPDPLIFDGKDNRYFEQIEMVYDINNLAEKKVLDLGCGNGSLFFWLMAKKIVLQEYIGIDFAHPASNLGNNACITQRDIRDIQLNKTNANTVFAINVLCYMSDELIDSVFQPLKKNSELIIIEPVPSLFWDAHFEGVKLFYRDNHKLKKILESKGWQVKNAATDYGCKFKGAYFLPLSYCLFLVSDISKDNFPS